MNANFKINTIDFCVPLDMYKDFEVASIPHPYNIYLNKYIKIDGYDKIAILMDQNIDLERVEFKQTIHDVPIYLIHATEQNKNVNTVLSVINFLSNNGMNKNSMLYVIGGGITQDIGAFACAMYKRGLPWTFVPTTLLSMADSCVGGKTALNFSDKKNILGLFSSPHAVYIYPSLLDTLPSIDMYSGYGEMFRLFITGGIDSTFLHSCMIIPALRIKQAVVEKDEFEHDIRRAMNYGHSIGHAFEAITEYKIPHGIAVTLGILIENEISCILGYLNKHTADELLKIGKTLVPKEILPILNTINLSHILEYLKQDKKTEGNVLKIPFLVAMGNIQIKDFELNDTNKDKIMIATNYVSTLLGEKE